RAEVPYTLAFVTLDEGPTMLTNIVQCDPKALEGGQAVRGVFRAAENGPHLPIFTRACQRRHDPLPVYSFVPSAASAALHGHRRSAGTRRANGSAVVRRPRGRRDQAPNSARRAWWRGFHRWGQPRPAR